MSEMVGNPVVEYRNTGLAEATETHAGTKAQTEIVGTSGVTQTPLIKTLMAEFIGTFAILFVGISTVYWAISDPLSVGIATGLVVGAMVCMFAGLGSGHFNPAITLGMLVAGRTSFSRALAMMATQIGAAAIAAFMLVSILGDNEIVRWTEVRPDGAVYTPKPVETAVPNIPPRIVDGVPAAETPRVSTSKAIMIEAMLAFFWGAAFFALIARGRNPILGRLAVGAVVTAMIFCCFVLTGAAMNPVRAFGPALASGTWANQLIYWIGPMLGGALAGLVCGRILFPAEKQSDDTEALPTFSR